MGKSVDKTNGGFVGRIDGMNKLDPNSYKGSVLNARILWTFSAAYNTIKNPKYLETADPAFAFFGQSFY
jgi:mannobiose 2-epimerase